MRMLKYIFWSVVIYFLVRFVVNFVIPVVRAGRQMRAQVKEFQEKMNQDASGVCVGVAMELLVKT